MPHEPSDAAGDDDPGRPVGAVEERAEVAQLRVVHPHRQAPQVGVGAAQAGRLQDVRGAEGDHRGVAGPGVLVEPGDRPGARAAGSAGPPRRPARRRSRPPSGRTSRRRARRPGSGRWQAAAVSSTRPGHQPHQVVQPVAAAAQHHEQLPRQRRERGPAQVGARRRTAGARSGSRRASTTARTGAPVATRASSIAAEPARGAAGGGARDHRGRLLAEDHDGVPQLARVGAAGGGRPHRDRDGRRPRRRRRRAPAGPGG